MIANGVSVGTIRDKASEPLDHPWMQEEAPPVILSAGRFSKQKNFTDLIRALTIIRRDVPARLVILGDGTAAQRAELESLGGGTSASAIRAAPWF